MKRSEQKKENCWSIEDLFKDNSQWNEEYQWVKEQVPKLTEYKETLVNADKLLSYLELEEELSKKLERLYVYANQRLHENTADSMYQELSDKAAMLSVEMSTATAFFEPELLKLSKEELESMTQTTEKLKKYKRVLFEIFRDKEHILSDELEAVLASAGEMSQVPSDVFSMFNNADIRFEDALDEEGNSHTLTHGSYSVMMESKDRELRKSAFTNIYKAYKSHKNTLAATFRGNVKNCNFYAKTRKFKDSLEYKLSGSRIPTDVYHQLIDTVHEFLPLMHRYVELRKKALKLDEIHMYDLYTPMVSGVDMKIPFEEAKEIVLEGLKPLGEDYLDVLKEGFNNRWIDVYENEGKRSGAYSWGAYGTHPYVLLNYQDNLNNVFTLAHEMGHALHSYFSDSEQEFVDASYRIFVAEVASTCNESLLIHHLLKKTEDKKEKAYLVNYFLEQFKGTLFRQTMFAEFEYKMHNMVNNGEGLTVDRICEEYYKLNLDYFGKEMTVDQDIEMEWARIPHFYTPFYVYQYATGFSAAVAISRKILSGDMEVLEGYKRFLHSGGSMDPIDLLKLAGVDMTKKEPITEAMGLFEELLEEMESLCL